MAPRDIAPKVDPPCDDLVAGPLGNARKSLQNLLPTEAETLVTILGWVEVAMECSLEPEQRKNVRQHSWHALQLIRTIEDRHRDGYLPKPVADCIDTVRKEINSAIKRLEGTE